MTMKKDEEGFEVVDKRRSTAPEPSEGAEPGPAEDKAAHEQEADGQLSFDVPSLLGYMLGLLGSAAWRWMGVVVNPATGRAETDLAQARLAIDTFEFVASRLLPLMDERGQRDLRAALSDLRMNYVERSAGSTGAAE